MPKWNIDKRCLTKTSPQYGVSERIKAGIISITNKLYARKTHPDPQAVHNGHGQEVRKIKYQMCQTMHILKIKYQIICHPFHKSVENREVSPLSLTGTI